LTFERETRTTTQYISAMSDQKGPSAPQNQYSEAPPPYPGTGQTYAEQKPYAPVGGAPPQHTGGTPYPPASSYPPYGGYYQTPPQAVPAGAAAGTTTVIVTGGAMGMLGPHSMAMLCPRCGAQVVTETQPVSGTLTWLLCILIAVVGCFWGCCLIPFCVDECQDVEHRCPSCKAHLGTYRRM